MAHIAEHKIATLEAMLAVATESWKDSQTLTTPIKMFLDLAITELPEVISSIREYNEALRVCHTAMRHNNWHRIKDGKGLVPEPLSAEDAYTLVCNALSEE